MCFGNAQTSQTQTNQTSTPSPWVTAAAKQNLNAVGGLQTNGFTPYTGEQVAGFSPQQSQSFNLGADVAGGVSPYVGEAGGLINSYANAGPQSVTPETISSQMSPYMSQYVNMALQPQLQAQDVQFANQNKAADAAATGAGAYGDTGWGQLRGTTTQAQDAARSGLVGNAYNTAFNTAIGAGAQDVANNLTGQETNANLAETALGRQLTGATALTNAGTGATNLINTLGGQQTAQSQAQLNAAYNQWLMSRQYPFQTATAMDQAIVAGNAGSPTTTSGTSTTSAPDNSGYGILGSLLGSAGSAPAGSMFASMLADGGVTTPGQPTVVGERGPELIVPNATSLVIPNEVLEAARKLRDKKIGKDGKSNIQFGIAA
jgi:hypothetical protein